MTHFTGEDHIILDHFIGRPDFKATCIPETLNLQTSEVMAKARNDLLVLSGWVALQSSLVRKFSSTCSSEGIAGIGK